LSLLDTPATHSRRLLDDHGVLASIGSVGDATTRRSPRASSIPSKTELIADRVWRGKAQLELAIVEYVGRFKHTHLHEALGDIPPDELE
jgi:hypothetical protein